MNSMQQEVENPALYAGALSRMGRGPDTQLLHVTDSEVDALNGLSGLVFNEPLRTNPETGLPEAGIFKRLLPMIASAAAIYFTGGAAAGMLGGTTAAAAGTGATMAGTALAGFGGHALGQLAAEGEIDFGRAAMAGGMSGLTAGIGKGFGGAGDGGIAADFELAGAAAPSFDPATMVDAGTAASASSADAVNAMAQASGSTPMFADNAASWTDMSDWADIPGINDPYAGAESIFEGAYPGASRSIPDSSLLDGELFAGSAGYAEPSMPNPVPMTRGQQFISDLKNPEEVYKEIAKDPLGEFKKLQQMALFSGAFDEPLAPSGPSRTPFTPKDFDFNRRRRNLDVDEDGEVTQEDILHLTENKLPEGQSSRFYTDSAFTENEELNAKEGGLLRLKTGGNIQEAIGALTGGAGASMLPMIAQSVVKAEDEDEEESISKGYPVGKAGTAPGMPTTGVAVGGGQPPQPFQTGGDTGSSTEASLEGNVSTMGQPIGNALGMAFGPLGSVVGSVLGSEVNQAMNENAAQAAFDEGDTFSAPVGFANPEGVPNINTTQAFLSHIPIIGHFFDSKAQQTAQNTRKANETLLAEQVLTGLPTKEQQLAPPIPVPVQQAPIPIPLEQAPIPAPKTPIKSPIPVPKAPIPVPVIPVVTAPLAAEAEAEAAAQESFNAAMGLASLAMAEEDAPEEGQPGNPGVPGAQGIASLASQAMDTFSEGPDPGPTGGPSGPGTGGGESTGGGHDLGGGGAFGGDDTGPDGPDGSGSGSGSGSGPGDGGADGADGGYEQGGYLGGVSGRAYGGLLQLAGGGSVPYFEGRVMPTGNMTEDGMSDNIPFVIAGRQEGGQMGMQPAVLSPDEYVIPADVVSMLGNGSSTSGANDLDQFINNFRMDKYGRPKQPPEMSGGLSSLA